MAAQIVGQIGLLNAVEKHLREFRRGGTGPQLWAAVRAWQSRPILERLRRRLAGVRRRVLPKSLLGQAIDYLLSRGGLDQLPRRWPTGNRQQCL